MFKFTRGRRGFTLVELAIVLVIIGIIMGLALKGSSLIRGAKLRSEIRKIDKLQTALMAYINLYKGELPEYSDNSSAPFSIDYRLFLEQDLIKMNDMLATLNTTDDIAGAVNTYAVWGYAMCGTGTDNYTYYDTDCDRAGIMVCPNICIAGMRLNFDRSVDYSPVLLETKCAIEAMADDKDYASGAGRLASTNFGPPPDLEFSRAEICSPEMNYRDFAPGQSVGSTYLFRIY
ncbi:MAG: type II secretion system GspH family protein [Deferribacteraceae bacterium]|jgi:prepilin-type N-terminal cleavage/methylation domain-containing protein|nr:type II secretion system GspH family protein [Deferribacteraceae bacterium]